MVRPDGIEAALKRRIVAAARGLALPVWARPAIFRAGAARHPGRPRWQPARHRPAGVPESGANSVLPAALAARASPRPVRRSCTVRTPFGARTWHKLDWLSAAV